MKLLNEMLELGYGLCSGKLLEDEDVFEFKFEGIDEDTITLEVMNYLYFEERKGHITSWCRCFNENRFDDCGNERRWVISVFVPVEV